MTPSPAPFVSVVTFLNWFYSWAAAFGIDFRKHADPFCKADPKVVAGDGTHIGITLRRVNVTPISDPETEDVVPIGNRRFDRVFLQKRDDFSAKSMSDARKHLKYLCSKAKGNVSVNDRLDGCEERRRNIDLVNVADGDDSKTFLHQFIERDFEQNLLCPLADMLYILACDAPISAFLPFKELNAVENVLRELQQNQTPQHGLEHIGRTVSPELKLLLDEARHSRHLMMITNFILVLVERVRLVHSADRPSQAAEEVDGSYNPASGVCYYFTPSGKQLRKLPHYELNRTCKGRVDDEPAEEERCRKNYPLVSQSGYSHMFL